MLELWAQAERESRMHVSSSRTTLD